MSNCQKDVKCSKRSQISRSQTHGVWRKFTKKKREKRKRKKKDMRFTHIDIKYEGHQNWSKILPMYILRVFGHHHMWWQNWHQYLWTSCQFFFWTSSIVHVFWLFDIWLFFWQLFIIWHIAAPSPMCSITHGNKGDGDNFSSFDILLPHHLCVPLLMGTRVMGHIPLEIYMGAG